MQEFSIHKLFSCACYHDAHTLLSILKFVLDENKFQQKASKHQTLLFCFSFNPTLYFPPNECPSL